MLKKLQFTFEIDPKDLALLLVHAGKMNITSAETPRLVKSSPLALPSPKGAKSAAVLAYMREHKKADIATIAAATGIERKSLHNITYNLVHGKKLKRIAPGVFVLVEARNG